MLSEGLESNYNKNESLNILDTPYKMYEDQNLLHSKNITAFFQFLLLPIFTQKTRDCRDVKVMKLANFVGVMCKKIFVPTPSDPLDPLTPSGDKEITPPGL